MSNVHICTFQAVPTVNRKTKYEDLKAAVLAAGRFSAFEASDNRWSAGMYTRLCRDPDIEKVDLGYPWTGVKLRESPDLLANY